MGRDHKALMVAAQDAVAGPEGFDRRLADEPDTDGKGYRFSSWWNLGLKTLGSSVGCVRAVRRSRTMVCLVFKQLEEAFVLLGGRIIERPGEQSEQARHEDCTEGCRRPETTVMWHPTCSTELASR